MVKLFGLGPAILSSVGASMRVGRQPCNARTMKLENYTSEDPR